MGEMLYETVVLLQDSVGLSGAGGKGEVQEELVGGRHSSWKEQIIFKMHHKSCSLSAFEL